MNPLLNPIFLHRALKSYFSDIDRLKRITKNDLKKYQDKSLRQVVKYAFTVPMYKEKYKKAKIKPEDIRSIDDLKKLPFITKDDIKKYSPDGIIPATFDKKSALIGRTGGTTRKPIMIFLDPFTVVKSMLGLIRTMKEYDINWRKTKMSLLLDLTDNSFEEAYFVNSVSSFIRPFFSQKNMKVFNQLEQPLDLIKKIEEFRPELLAAYPSMVNELALLKIRGFGKNLNPRLIMTSGQFIDDNTRKFIEKTFDVPVYDSYIATETGPIAFECKNKTYHIHSDLVYPEFINNRDENVYDEPGSIIITKLYGAGTPLIRYTGLGDIITPSENGCNCGISGRQIKKIHGRKYNSIILPDGRRIMRSFMENIFSEIFLKTKVNNQKRTQIIQHKIDSIEIKIEFDKDLENIGYSTEELFSSMKNKMQKAFGPDIEIVFNEVDEFCDKAPYLVSKINRDKFIEKNYVV
jgi:phenylacetate-CoA ligase